MLKAAGDQGTEWSSELHNAIIRERKISEDWKQSILLTVLKGKEDSLECGSYRAIKLLEHGLKVLERVMKKRIREQAKVDYMQFRLLQARVQRLLYL
jgi:hypothetical protein